MGKNFRMKRRLARLRKFFRKKEPKMGEIQKRGYAITIRLLNDSKSDLTMFPETKTESSKRYIKKGEIFVTIQRGNLNVINGIYHYDIHLSDKMYDYIVGKFNERLRKKCVKYENEIKNKVTSRLDEILDNIKNQS